MSEGIVVIETITSEVLKNNPLGDPHVRRLPIYLPPGYESGTKRYPVVYVLTGFTGRGMMLAQRRGVGRESCSTDGSFDRAGRGAADDLGDARLLHARWRQPIHQLVGDGAL